MIVGFALGALYSATGNLLAPVVAHTVINGINLPLLVNRYRSEDVESEVERELD